MRTPASLAALWCAALVVPGCKSREPAPAGAPAAARPAPRSHVVDRPQVLAELSLDGSGAGAPPPAPGAEFVFAARGGAVAWVTGGEGRSRVVHNGRVGHAYDAIGALVLGPDGRRSAYTAHGADGRWRIVVDGVERGTFEEVGPPVFSDDGVHLAYTVKQGAGRHLVVDGVTGPATAGTYLHYHFVANGSQVVYVEAPAGEAAGRLVVADLSLDRRTVIEPKVTTAKMNADGTRLGALADRDGRQQVLSLPVDRPGDVTREREYDGIAGFDYALQRTAPVYLGERDGGRVLVLGRREVPAPREPLVTYPVPLPDETGLGVFVADGTGVTFREFLVDAPAHEARYDEAERVVYAPTGRSHAYAARRGDRWMAVVNGKDGPAFDRVVSPQFSPDGRFVVYRARQGGRRFVVVADAAAATVRQHPAYEQVFPVQFTEGGKAVAYGVKDGRQLAWKVEPL